MELEAKPELLAVGQVALLGRQILEGVAFLQALGLPTGCLPRARGVARVPEHGALLWWPSWSPIRVEVVVAESEPSFPSTWRPRASTEATHGRAREGRTTI